MNFTNTGIVTVRKDRACAICDNMINRGTVCKTLNRKGVGRKWVCLSCVERIDELESLSGGLGANFDDEGYAQVCLESNGLL